MNPPTTSSDIESTQTVQVAEDSAVPEPSPMWIQPFLDNPKGLRFLVGTLSLDNVELLTQFARCFKDVFVKEEEGKISYTYPDEVGFHVAYTTWASMKANNDLAELDLAKEVAESKMRRCFKDIYYLGVVDMDAITFCGAVDVKAMVIGQSFHGYNERTLAVKEARELQAKILKKYEGVGHESIFLMLKEPVNAIVEKMVPEFQRPQNGVWSKDQKCAMLKQFCEKRFDNFYDVEPCMIPCAGEMCMNSIMRTIRLTFVSSLFVCTGQHRCYAFQQIMAESREEFKSMVSSSFAVGVFDCMPKQVAHFMSKVRPSHRDMAAHIKYATSIIPVMCRAAI